MWRQDVQVFVPVVQMTERAFIRVSEFLFGVVGWFALRPRGIDGGGPLRVSDLDSWEVFYVTETLINCEAVCVELYEY